MGKKSEARELRKAEQQRQFEANKASFLAKVADDKQPRQAPVAPKDPTPRLAPHLARAIAEAEKAPKTASTGSRFTSRVSWCVNKADRDDEWSWGEPRDWTEDEWETTILPAFQQFEQLTWQEIDDASSGAGHKMHHGHEISDLIKEAQDRWSTLGLEEYDSIFRFRLGGQRKRAWGYIAQAHFHFIWWDREHSLYPTEPK